jgi:hypothetical protein
LFVEQTHSNFCEQEWLAGKGGKTVQVVEATMVCPAINIVVLLRRRRLVKSKGGGETSLVFFSLFFVVKKMTTKIYFHLVFYYLTNQLRLDGDRFSISTSLSMETAREVVCVEADNRRFLFSGTQAEMADWTNAILAKVACLNYLKALQKGNKEPWASVLNFVNNTHRIFSFENTPIRIEDCRCLVPSLSYHTTVTSLSLQNSQLNDDTLTTLAAMFDHNTSLIHLNLADNVITHDGVAALASRLIQRSHLSQQKQPPQPLELYSLQTLILDGNDIGDKGCAALSPLISSVRPLLSHISLKKVGLSDSGGAVFAAALQKRADELKAHEWPIIELSSNAIGDVTLKALVQTLDRLNVKELRLSNNLVSFQKK